MHALVRISVAFAVVALGGCLVPDVNLEGKACGGDAGGGAPHACVEGFQCVQGICVPPGFDAGHGDEITDAGAPGNSLAGTMAFAVHHQYGDAKVDGGRGQDVTAVLTQNAITCPPPASAYESTPGWILEIGLHTVNDTQPIIAAGVSYPLGLNDGGTDAIEANALLAHNLADGGRDFFAEGGAGLSGTVTPSVFARDHVAGTFRLQLHALADGGLTPTDAGTLTGTFNANATECAP